MRNTFPIASFTGQDRPCVSFLTVPVCRQESVLPPFNYLSEPNDPLVTGYLLSPDVDYLFRPNAVGTFCLPTPTSPITKSVDIVYSTDHRRFQVVRTESD